jgi:uroporphyrinogen decarboxylase
MMTGYERFKMALMRQGEPDIVPMWELIINEPTLSFFGAKDRNDLAEIANLDAVTVSENQVRIPVTDEQQADLKSRGKVIMEGTRHLGADEWGVIGGFTEIGIPYPVDGPIRCPADLKRYTPPDPEADHHFAGLRDAVKRFKGRKFIVFVAHESFEFSHYMRGGMENVFEDYIENPEFAHELSEMITDYKIRIMRRAAKEGADAIITGDDYATSQGPIMSPRHFREFIFPYLKKCVDAVHDTGLPFIKHSDGNLWPIMDMLLEAGIDALDPVEPAAGMDIGEVKRKLGDRISLIGNVDCSFLLTMGSTDDVVEAVKETIAKASVGGGHILASSNSIHPAVKPENYRAMIDAARTFGRYPLDKKMVEEYRKKNYIERWVHDLVSRG